MGVTVEEGAKAISADLPYLSEPAWAAATAWTKVFALTVGGEGITPVAIVGL